MEKGFYYISDNITERCYYLTGEQNGNKVVNFANISDNKKNTVINPQWKSLINLPEESLIKSATFHKLNPTNCVLK